MHEHVENKIGHILPIILCASLHCWEFMRSFAHNCQQHPTSAKPTTPKNNWELLRPFALGLSGSQSHGKIFTFQVLLFNYFSNALMRVVLINFLTSNLLSKNEQYE